jgi:LmbE family N-acetylglucosaminyl deacetylase
MSLTGISVAGVIDDSEIERVLCVKAHPDDVDFGTAGTVASWTAKGIEVAYCIVTDGDAGGFDPSVARTEIAGIRQAEQRAAAAEIGVSDVRFLGYPDGRLEVSLQLRADIARVIREARPQRVVCQNPQRNLNRVYGSHPDHMAAAEATLCAVYPDARNAFTFIEEIGGLEPWTVSEVWIAEANEINHYSDITATFDKKLAALLRHQSQITDPDRLREQLRWWNGGNATAGGFPEGSYAEAFYVMDTA